jgi:hypothetical protein
MYPSREFRLKRKDAKFEFHLGVADERSSPGKAIIYLGPQRCSPPFAVKS